MIEPKFVYYFNNVIDVILTRSGSLDIGTEYWMTPLTVKEDKSR